MGRNPGKAQRDVTLIDVLIDGFEKNEIMDDLHWRSLPMPDEESAVAKFAELAGEATRWKGAPATLEDRGPRRIAAWPDLEIRQAERGVMVRVRAPWFGWWHESSTWAGEPMGPLYDWLRDERTARSPVAPA